MSDAANPLGDALRGLFLRAPQGPRTLSAPVSPPPGLEPPTPLPDAENGYVTLQGLVRNWPSEGHLPPDLLHWRDLYTTERETGERVLRPLRPILERLDPVLAAPRWQVTVGERLDWPEMKSLRRVGQALLLRAVLDGRSEDRERALTLARRLRRSEGLTLHFLFGSLIERDAGYPVDGLAEDRHEAVRWELARIVVPFASRIGPWEPPLTHDFGNSADERRAIAWALADHSNAYDPVATVDRYLKHRVAMEGASADELRRLASGLIAPWPPELVVPGGFGGRAPLLALRRARSALRKVADPYGRLCIAQTLHILGGTIAMVEKATT